MSIIYEPEYRLLIECLKESRLHSKMTQQELAMHLGCSQAYISKYEQGQKRLDIIEVRNICHCLGITLPDIINQFEERLKKEGINNG